MRATERARQGDIVGERLRQIAQHRFANGVEVVVEAVHIGELRQHFRHGQANAFEPLDHRRLQLGSRFADDAIQPLDQCFERHGLRQPRVHHARCRRREIPGGVEGSGDEQPAFTNHAQEEQQRPEQGRRASDDVTRAVKVEQRTRTERKIRH